MSETVDPGLLAAVRETSRLAQFGWASQAQKHKMLWFAMWSDRYILWNWPPRSSTLNPPLGGQSPHPLACCQHGARGCPRELWWLSTLATMGLAARHLSIEHLFQFGVKGESPMIRR
jgi:hypothetical protein